MSYSTPSTPSTAQALPDDAPTGTWRHPEFDKIQKRMQASRFDDRNVRTVLWNLALLVVTFFLPAVSSLKSIHHSFDSFAKTMTPYTFYALWSIRLIPILAIFSAVYPLLGPQDDLSDIPLTPSQRSLLGLEPSTKPASPMGNYVTPPRYARSVTPSSGRSLSGSPFSGRDSVGSTMGNTYSPTASPLLHKAIGREARRQSLGAGTSLQYSKALNDASSALVTSTTSPSGGGRNNASVGLNSRWLYEKGRGSPGMRGVYT